MALVTDGASVIISLAGMRKRKRLGESAASTLVGGIATNKITTFLWKRKRGSGSGNKIRPFHISGVHTNDQ